MFHFTNMLRENEKVESKEFVLCVNDTEHVI